jgi:hypothetical protein
MLSLAIILSSSELAVSLTPALFLSLTLILFLFLGLA